nr:hypothetical protein [uncultured Carboxylicivirga sp.]
MKNLNELGVQELNTMEMQKTDGGGILAEILGAIVGGAMAVAYVDGNYYYTLTDNPYYSPLR